MRITFNELRTLRVHKRPAAVGKRIVIPILYSLSLAFIALTVEFFQAHEVKARRAVTNRKWRIEAMNPQKLRYMYIDKSGNVTIDASKFQEARRFAEGLAAVMIDDQYGFIDKKGELVIQANLASVGDFSEGLVVAAEIGQYGYIDKSGSWKIRPKFDYADDFSEGLAIVVVGDSYSYIDRSGQPILSPDSIPEGRSIASSNFSDGLAKILVGERLGFMDKSGKIVIPPQFTGAGKFSEGLARVERVDGKLGYIDRSGRFVIKPSFNTDGDLEQNSTDFSEGWASLTENLKPSQTSSEKWVYINRTGRVVLRTKYFYAGPFKEGLAVVYDDKSKKCGYIDKRGRVVIPLIYERASDFSEGLACVAIAD